MNEKFYELPKERQYSIINSGFKVFSTYNYIKASRENDLAEMLASELANIDYTKFRDDISPKDVIEILSYSLDGYLQHKFRINEALNIDDIMQKYKTWAQLLKRSSYQ